MQKRATNWGWLIRATLAFCAIFGASSFAPLFAQNSVGHIASVVDDDGRRFFVNAEPAPVKVNLAASKSRPNIWIPAEASLTGHGRPAMDMGRDGVEKIVREASDRHSVDPALVRAVIETESNWNPRAYSRKGAGGLMQLIPTTAQRYGANDVFDPQQNVDAGVKHLKRLLERYNGNLDLALAAYNAGEGAVDRVHGIPAYRETQNYVQKVQNAYFRPGSGRLPDAYVNPHAIHRDVTTDGRIIFTNE
ncbi:MAG TPA: lytic transglycosylase domain-containing protein [Candidatus Acidoferrum sp.]|nr:lytic transglycosylase domain-containing protein [Candidatus Acidoferrum sp.]